MKKRGPIVGFIGVVITMAAFLTILSLVPGVGPTVNGELFIPNILEGMFNEVTNEIQIYPGEINTFSYASSVSEIPLLWGLQIIDYQEGDTFTVSVSNIYGDTFGTFEQSGPVLFDMFVVPNSDTISFQVQNTGDRPINVMMMFVEDPDNSEALSDPDSPLMSTLIPLAISGILLIVGIVVIIAGAIITLVDWRKTKDQSRNF